MTARTYSAAEIRAKAHEVALRIHREGRFGPSWLAWIEGRVTKAFADVFPDPPPEPPPPWALRLREEPDPKEREWLWSWWIGRGFQVRHVTTPDEWETPTTGWFEDNGSTMADRMGLLADLAAYPMRLPDGRPCTLTGEAKP